MIRSIFLLAFLISISTVSDAQTFKVIGYLPTYKFNWIDQIELDYLTHLNISFANPNHLGQLITDGVDIDPIVEKAHDAGVKVFIALGGGGARLSDWQDWITVSNRAVFIQGIVAYVLEHNLQGVDVDLEWSVVNDDYSGFVLELRDSLTKHNLLISAALPGTYRYPQITNAALNAFDWINLMAYDLTGPWTPTNPGQHSPFSAAQNSIDYWSIQGVGKNKIILGVPFYGYDFTDQSNVTSVTYSEMVSRNQANAELDQVGQIYYNGLPTISKKTQLAKSKVNGIMIWELAQDSFSEYSLLKRIHNTINLITSLPENEGPPQIRAYPNPTHGEVTLDFQTSRDIEIGVFTLYQKNIANHRFENQNLVSLNLSGLPNGIYLLSIKTKDTSTTLKIIKL